jgi:predicted dehydrogenase
MRIGTIGSGFIVEFILKNIQKTEGIFCEAVYSRTEEKGRALADKFGVQKVYTDLDAMCADPDIDFIYIASPNSLHFAHAKKALAPLDANVEVSLENKCAVISAEADNDAIIAAITEAGYSVTGIE